MSATIPPASTPPDEPASPAPAAHAGPAARPTGSKAGRILRRTLVGSSLTVSLALLLWWNDHAAARGAPITFTAAFVLLATLLETSRMGSLALLDLRPPLFVAGLLAIVTILGRGPLVPLTEQVRDAAPHARLALEYLVHAAAALAAGLATFGVVRISARFLPLVAAHLVGYAAFAIAFRVLPGIDPGARPWLPLATIAGVAALTLPLTLRAPGGGRRAAIVAGLCLWIVPALALVPIVFRAFDTRGLVALLVISKIGDTCGYYVGNAIGKTHPFPTISPGKTTAGCVGSFAGAVAAALALRWAGVLPGSPFGFAGTVLAGALLNLAAQSGDLLKSWVKRRAGVKDSSTIFGPAGGLLDQVDSLLLTVPVCLATWPILFEGVAR